MRIDPLTRLVVRAALIGGSLASGSLFWVRAALGENQLRMHDCSADGAISIGGVSEQLYGEGFVLAWHEVLGRELGERLPAVLNEVGRRGARWEVSEAIRRGVWVPAILRPFVGRRDLIDKVRGSAFYHALMQESLRILFRGLHGDDLRHAGVGARDDMPRPGRSRLHVRGDAGRGRRLRTRAERTAPGEGVTRATARLARRRPCTRAAPRGSRSARAARRRSARVAANKPVRAAGSQHDACGRSAPRTRRRRRRAPARRS